MKQWYALYVVLYSYEVFRYHSITAAAILNEASSVRALFVWQILHKRSSSQAHKQQPSFHPRAVFAQTSRRRHIAFLTQPIPEGFTLKKGFIIKKMHFDAEDESLKCDKKRSLFTDRRKLIVDIRTWLKRITIKSLKPLTQPMPQGMPAALFPYKFAFISLTFWITIQIRWKFQLVFIHFLITSSLQISSYTTSVPLSRQHVNIWWHDSHKWDYTQTNYPTNLKCHGHVVNETGPNRHYAGVSVYEHMD